MHDGALGEAGLAAVLDRVSDGVVTVDPNFVFTSVNAAAGELARRMPETLMGRHMFDAFPEARGSVFEERFREAFDTQQVLEFEQGSAILGVHPALSVQACTWSVDALQGKPREKKPVYRIEF